jgi:hypothetical protein
MLHLVTEGYVKRALPQYVDVPIRKVAMLENAHLETVVHSATSGMDLVDCY